MTDRSYSGTRTWQADFCQLLGQQSDAKYEHDGSPAFKECYDLLGRLVQPAVDRLQLLRWLFFNMCAGNNDAHAKNLSIIATPAGLRLADHGEEAAGVHGTADRP